MRSWSIKPPLGWPINRAHPQAHRLVGCWMMQEGGGLSAYDLSGGRRLWVITEANLSATTALLPEEH